MKKQVLFLMLIIFALFSVPALADNDAAAFSVTVPSVLPVVVGADGGVSVADDARIVNNGTFPVKVDSISVEPQNGWQLDAWGTDYSAVQVNSRHFSMQLGGALVPVSGTVDVSGYAAISGGGSMALAYDTRFPVQTANLNETIAKVIFTVSWDGHGPMTGISVTRNPYYTEYMEGAAFRTYYMTIAASYADGSSRPVTGWTVTDGDSLAEGQTSVTVSYTEDGITKTAQIPINVTPLARAILYSDGELVFQRGSTPESGRTVVESYTGFETTRYVYVRINGSFAATTPWYSRRTEIRTVTFSDTISPKYLSYWFYGCTNLSSLIGVNKLDTGAVAAMNNAFGQCTSLTSVNLIPWDTSKVTNMNGMFAGCTALATANLSRWNTAAVTDMSNMFSGCTALRSVGLTSWNTAAVQNMSSMFFKCSALTSLNLSAWDTSAVTNMQYMFSGCYGLRQLNIADWNTSNVTAMNNMFDLSGGTSQLTALDVKSWDTSNVTDMNKLFMGCDGLTSLDLSGWNTSGTITMEYMFAYCSSLTYLNLSSFNTSAVTSMWGMFTGCDSLNALDLSSFNTSRVTNMIAMFADCDVLAAIYVSETFVTASVTDSEGMFFYSFNIVGGNGTIYNSGVLDATYARIDRAGTPGYFTAKSVGLSSVASISVLGDTTALLPFEEIAAEEIEAESGSISGNDTETEHDAEQREEGESLGCPEDFNETVEMRDGSGVSGEI